MPEVAVVPEMKDREIEEVNRYVVGQQYAKHRLYHLIYITCTYVFMPYISQRGPPPSSSLSRATRSSYPFDNTMDLVETDPESGEQSEPSKSKAHSRCISRLLSWMNTWSKTNTATEDACEIAPRQMARQMARQSTEQ